MAGLELPVDWLSLPQHLLVKCLTFRKVVDLGLCPQLQWSATQQSVFATCKVFAQALLTANKPRVKIAVDERDEASILALASVLKWAAPSCGTPLELHMQSAVHASTAPVLEVLYRVLGPIPAVTRLHCEDIGVRDFSEHHASAPVCQRLLITGVAPTSALASTDSQHMQPAHPRSAQEVLLEWPSHAPLPMLFPNLREITLNNCCYALLGALPLLGCELLTHLKLGLREYPCLFSVPPPPPCLGWPLAELPWSQQLAQIPNLSALSLSVSKLMHSAEKRVLAAVAQCGNVRQLELGSCNIASLAKLNSLPHLQEISIGEARGGDDDALLTALLQFPYVTRITCPRFTELQRSYAKAPCNWRHLTIRTATPQLLARLPLHALEHPLQLQRLRLDTASSDDVEEAVHNLGRSGQNVYATPGFELCFSKAQHPASAASVLRVSGPLLPRNVRKLRCWKLQADVEVATALKHALPPNIKHLDLSNSHVQPGAWVQLGRSLAQQLEEMEIWHHPTYTPLVLLTYFTVACCQPGAKPLTPGGLPKVARVKMCDLYRHRQDTWDPEQEQLLQEAMQQLGLPPDQFLVFHD